MPRETTAPRLDHEREQYTVAEIAMVLGFKRRGGHADTSKAARRLAQLGVPVYPGRVKTVLREELASHAPKLFAVLTGASERARS